MNTHPRTEKLDLRLTTEAKRALRRAAEATRQSVSEFVLSSALTRAEEVLAEQTTVMLSPADWSAFVAALDSPPSLPGDRLARLMSEPSAFDS